MSISNLSDQKKVMTQQLSSQNNTKDEIEILKGQKDQLTGSNLQNPGEQQDLLLPPKKSRLVQKNSNSDNVTQIFLGDTPKNAQSEFSFAAGAANGENTDRSRSNLNFESAF